ncbi:MAG: lysylphosphatidylglycerol synthase domain-containing protein [Verrucomicrobiota bacterium]
MKQKFGIILTAILLIGLLVWFLIREESFSEFASTLKSFGILRILAAIAIGASISLIGSVRYWRLVTDVGHSIPFRDACRIFAFGALGGMVFFQFYGQMAVRSSLMQRHGITPEDVMIVSLIERSAALLALGMMASVAGVYLISDQISHIEIRFGEFLMMLLAILTIILIAVRMLKPALMELGLRSLAQTLGRAGLRSILLTFLMHGLTLATFLLFLSPLSKTSSLAEEISACLLVMFVASIPISFSGWGVRELSASYAFSIIGLAVSQSVAVSVAVGITSLAGLLFFSLAIWKWGAISTLNSIVPKIRQEKISESDSLLIPRGIFALCVGTAVAVLILFQVRVPIGDGFVTANLADPFVIFSSVVSLIVIRQQVRSGVVAIQKLPLYALGIGLLVFIGGFINGVFRFGYTDWAFMNRTVGVLLILGYALCGAYVAQIGKGFSARTIVSRLYLISCCVVVAICFGREFIGTVFPGLNFETLFRTPFRMEGFARNPNAFGFQLCVAIAILVGQFTSKDKPRWSWIVASGLLFVGVYESASRGAVLVLIAISMLVVLQRIRRPIFPLLAGIGMAVILSFPISFAEWFSSYARSALSFMNASGVWEFLLELFSGPEKNAVDYGEISSTADLARWETLRGGFEMFRENWFFGAGLGAYLYQSTVEGNPLVIHSTPVWILAEFGLLGFSVFCFGLALLVRLGLTKMKDFRSGDQCEPDLGLMMIILLVIFLGYGIPHEMFYQRTFWFFVGIVGSELFMKDRLRELNQSSKATE